MYKLFGALLALLILCNLKPVLLRKISHQGCLPGLPENEFAFGGNGYVALENRGIKPRNFSHIKLSFKTSGDEGLVYFAGMPKGHFESLELNNGKVIYQFELGSGLVKMASDKCYNDGKWHVLEVKWMQEDSSLVIDDRIESVAQSPERFKSLNYANAVYFGGFKGQHNIEGITVKGFHGSIKDVQLGGTSRRLSIHTEMRNARSGCPRRWRREVANDPATQLYASYTGSTNVELYWKTTRCCSEFAIEWHKLEEEVGTDAPSKTVTDYLVEIDKLEPNTTYRFTLKGRMANQAETELKEMNHTTMEDTHPSLTVDSVSESSLSVSWKPSENFVVSLSGNSHNISVTNGMNYTFENLIPGTPYILNFTDNSNGQTTEREIVTIPNPVIVTTASPSTDKISLSWVNTSEVEVMYSTLDECQLKRLSGTSGTISNLWPGCLYRLDVFAVSSGRRRNGSQTVDVETIASPLENFTCSTGAEAGNIQCNWSHVQKFLRSCLQYTLKFSSSQNYTTEVTKQRTQGTYTLTPGERYSILILRETSNGSAIPTLTTVATAKPGIDDKFFKDHSDSTIDTISFSYVKDIHHVIDYYNVSFNGTSDLLSDSITKVSFGNLEAGHCYTFTAFTMSHDEHSKMLSDVICTVPYPPSSAECQSITRSSLFLGINATAGGHVDHYDIRTNSKSENIKSEVEADAETVFYNISSLRPYTEYDISVYSVVEKHHREKKSSTVNFKCRTAESTPSRITTFFNTSYLSDKVTLNWHKPYPENGVIIGYVIRVDQTGKSTKVIDDINGEQTSYELTYPNVQEGETYNISISARTSAGESEIFSKFFTLKDQPFNALFVVLAILLAILFIVLIGLLLYYYVRNSPQRMQSFRRMSSRLRNPIDHIAMVFPQPSVTSKPIKISQFLEHIKFLEKDSGLKFTEEYEDLKYVGRNQSRDEAELQCNRVKNRFTNILPYDISRVKLLPMEDEDGSDYINASWIPGFHSKREFIASQGPLPSTVNDFWRMVWENNCQAIVMLTLCIEKGHIKCEQYWPLDKEPVFYGDLKVEIQNETKTDKWCILEFKISLGAQTRKVKHFHFTGWPDMYVPDKTSLIEFVRLVRDSINKSNSKGPAVVHCSAGVGRTGTFVALDTLLLYIQEGHDLDVYGIVFQMRMNRVLMVQTEAQYVFIYECLHEVLEEPNGQVEKIEEAAPEGDMKNEDSKEEPSKTESEPKSNSDSKEKPSNNKESESESKHNSESKEEEPSKKESDPKPNCDSNENKCSDYTVTKPGAESQKENATKEEGTNK